MGNRKDKVYPTIKDMQPHNQQQPYTGHTFINIRGTNGSGKTYTVNQITKGLIGEKRVIDGIKVTEYNHFFVIGSYDKACGGFDTITDFYSIAPLIHKLIQEKHVLGEGLIYSGVYRSSHKLGEDLRAAGHQMIWLCMDTDAQTCVDNVMKRRLADNKFKPFKSENLLKKMVAVQSCNNNAICYGENLVFGNTSRLNDAFEQIVFAGVNPNTFSNPTTYRVEFPHMEELHKLMPVIEAPQEVVAAAEVKQKDEAVGLFNMFGA